MRRRHSRFPRSSTHLGQRPATPGGCASARQRTAAALGIHRNTVRQRIARAEALLELDLADPDTRMDVWFTLGWSD